MTFHPRLDRIAQDSNYILEEDGLQSVRMSRESVPEQADTVIIGAGIVGCSSAYHLADCGATDVVVIDQGPLPTTGGSSSHAPGIMFQTDEPDVLSKFGMYSRDLYSDLEDESGQLYSEVGGIEVARTDERMEYLQRRVEWAKSWGVPNPEILTPEEVEDKLPLVDPDAIQGGYYSPTDGQVSGVKACAALAREAERHGVQFFGNTRVTEIETSDGSVDAVETDHGTIKAGRILVATNIWSRPLGETVGLDLPIAPVQHQYTITESLEALAENAQIVDHSVLDNYEAVTGSRAERLLMAPDRPILRDQDNALYFRTHGDAYGLGSYNHDPMVVDPDTLGTNEDGPDQGSIKPFTEEHFETPTHPNRPHKSPRQAIDELLPATRNAELEYKYNGLFSYAPDHLPVLGETPEIDDLWVALAIWVTHAGGAGNAIAEWMEHGVPKLGGEPIDLHDCDVARFQPHEGSKPYYTEMGDLQYEQVYDIVHPKWQRHRQRGLRRTPFYSAQDDLDAEFFESGGWESPQWYESNAGLLDEYSVAPRSGWEAEHWSRIEGAEHLAVRDGVGLFDQTSFIKIGIEGAGARSFVQRLFANDMDIDVGQLRYTTMLDTDGGVRADLTVTRLDKDQFLVLTGGGAGGRQDLDWIRDHAPVDVSVTDRTSEMCAVGLWGPDARNLLESATDADVSNDAFPYFRARNLYVGSVPVTALRVSYVGELGWEIYAPMEYGAELWETLCDTGQSYDVVPAGGGAMNSMRLEKGYRLWGEDLHTEHTPYEAGLGFTVDLDTSFIGKDALLDAREAGPRHKIACLTLEDPSAVILEDRPVLDGDEVLGYVHSAGYGYSIGACIAYTHLPPEYAEPDTSVEIQYEGDRYAATVREEPLFDPGRERMTK